MTFSHIRSLRADDLVVLDALLEANSTTAAARRVGLTQSAVSRVLARLRAALGDELFARTARGLRPTSRALALRPRLRQLLHELDGLLGEGEQFDAATAQATFRVACPDYIELTLLAPLMRRLARTAPGIQLQVVPLAGASDRQLESGELDVLFSPRRPAAAAVVWTPLIVEPYVALVDRKHPAERLTLDELERAPHVLVAPSGEPGTQLDELLAARRRARRIAVRVAGFLIVPHFLVGTDRIAILPERAARTLSAVHPVRVMELPVRLVPVTICAAWHEVRRTDAAHAWLRRMLVEPSTLGPAKGRR